MANQTVNVGPDSLPKLLIDLNGDESEFADAITAPACDNSETVEVDGATVAAAAWSVMGATATGGKRWACVRVSCDKAHTVEFYGDSADFTAITSAHKIKGYGGSGNADNSSTGGDSYLVPCAGHDYFSTRVQNNDGAADATVTVSVSFFD